MQSTTDVLFLFFAFWVYLKTVASMDHKEKTEKIIC